jgi:selenocysteine lyase/cysteine desulfurase
VRPPGDRVTYDVQALRAREYPWAERGEAIYLNNASTGAIPARTLRASADFSALRSEPWRLTDAAQFAILRRTRELAAKLINASPDEIACMSNTTYGLNIAARCLPLKAGDVVLTFDREFPANVYPWMALEKRGITLTRIPTRDRLPDEDALIAAMDGKNVKVVTIGWVNFATGYKADLARIGRECKKRGLYFVVDVMQGLGAATLDAPACNIDILACGGQKWLLSPWGSGFTYVRRELVRQLEPEAVGWMAMRASEDFTRLVDYEFAYHDDARRFEVITVPFQDFAGFNASVEMLVELGLANIEAHDAALVTQAVEWAQARKDMKLVTPADPARRAGIVSIAPPDPPAASERLKKSKISHSLREGAIRFSPHCYNTSAEITRALEVLAG